MLRRQFAALVAAPSVELAEPIERVFHTLKGAAATVGLTEVAELAKALQLRLAGAVEGEEPVNPRFVDDVARDAAWMFELAGLREVGLAPTTSPAPADVFAAEARRGLREAVERLARPPHDLAALAIALHRIKGSALVVGSAEAAATAGRVEELATGAEARVHPAIVIDGLTQLATLLAAPFDRAALTRALATAATNAGAPIAVPALVARAAQAAPPTPVSTTGAPASRRGWIRTAVGERVEPELWEAFEQECRELLEQIDKDILRLDHASDPRAVIQALFRSYHTLKGSVNTIGLIALGELIHTVEDLLERLGEHGAPRQLRALAAVLIEAQDQVRRGLGQAPRGYVETHPGRIAEQLAQVTDTDARRRHAAAGTVGHGRGRRSRDLGRRRQPGLAGSQRHRPRAGRAPLHPRAARPARRPDEPGRRAGRGPVAAGRSHRHAAHGPARPGRRAAAACSTPSSGSPPSTSSATSMAARRRAAPQPRPNRRRRATRASPRSSSIATTTSTSSRAA